MAEVDYYVWKIYSVLLLDFSSSFSIKGNVFHYPVVILKISPERLSMAQICKAGGLPFLHSPFINYSHKRVVYYTDPYQVLHLATAGTEPLKQRMHQR